MSMEKLRPEEESLRLVVEELKEQLAGKRRLRDDLEAKLKDSFSKIKELPERKKNCSEGRPFAKHLSLS